MWVSSSVHAGEVAHNMPCTPRPADNSSPRTDGGEAFAGKYAKKFGDCQWVMPGTMSSSTSVMMSDHDSPVCGGATGNDARMSPGSTWLSTGIVSTCSQ